MARCAHAAGHQSIERTGFIPDLEPPSSGTIGGWRARGLCAACSAAAAWTTRTGWTDIGKQDRGVRLGGAGAPPPPRRRRSRR